MKKLITHWKHTPGRHCGSTALSNLMHFYGHPLSEAICFGLGAGLGFFYLKGDYFNPTRALMTRSAGLEPNFFEAISVPFSWREEANNAKALSIAQKFIDSNIPVMLQTDIYYIDYYNSKTHFNGHIVVLCGYDDEKGTAYISDTHWNEIQELPFSSLEKARTSKSPPMMLENNYFEVDKINSSFDLKPAIRTALIKQAEDMLADSEAFGHYGVGGITAVADDFATWASVKDWKWAARFSYQIIEKRGTGGGAFRLMYSEFLKEAEEYIKELKSGEMSGKMRKIADKWTKLADLLKAISESEKATGFDKAATLISEIASLEKKFYKDILRMIK